MKIIFAARSVTLLLTAAAATVAAAEIGSTLCEHIFGTVERFRGHETLLRLFDLDSEANLPIWFQSVLLIVCSLLLATIAVGERRNRYWIQWLALSLLFLVMSVDEISEFHNRLPYALPIAMRAEGFAYFLWVIPGTVIVVALALFFARFVFSLPAGITRLFLLSGALYVGGALVMEILQGPIAEASAEQSLLFWLMADLEESLEMAGLVVFIHALLRYLARHVGPIEVVVAANHLDEQRRGSAAAPGVSPAAHG